MTQAVNSLPTRLVHGDEAAEKFMQERIYKPEQPLAYEYAGDVGDFLDKLETEYKIPPLMPEAVALQYLTGPATSQAMKAAGKGAEQAGMALERSMEPVVKGALERGGLPREMAMAMGANTQSNVVKPYGGNWLGGEDQLAIPERDLRRLKDSRGIQPDALKQLEADLKEISSLPNAERKHDFVIRQMQDEIDRARIPNAINKWIDSNLKNYVKKEMGTRDDPVRKLAEEGIIHMPLRDDLDRMEYLQAIRKAEGYPAEGMGKSPLAKQWENLSDDAIRVSKAGNIQEQANTGAKLEKARAELDAHKKQIDDDFITLLQGKGGLEIKDREIFDRMPNFQKAEILGDTKYKELQGVINDLLGQEHGFEKRAGETNPFVAKLDPETRLYSGSIYDLGFDHIIDVLKEDLGTGRIRPEQLNKVSMEQAVRRTYEYDQELAKKMNDARMTSRAELPVYKEYPEGLKWVQLNRPGDFAAESDAMGHSVRGYEPPESHPDWTKSSGEEGHSSYGLGGWEAIKSGRAKVYSLVDSKGAPHTTIEVASGAHPIGYSFKGASKELPETFEYNRNFDEGFPRPTAEQKQAILSRAQDIFKNNSNIERMDAFQMAANEVLGELPAEIRQIKGKGNAKPKDDYIPYVQDFVRSGKWNDVRDFQNTGLFKVEEGSTPPGFAEWMRLRALGNEPKVPAGYYTPEELAKYGEESGLKEKYPSVYGSWLKNLGLKPDVPMEPPPPMNGMKRGGKVSISNNPDTMMLELNNQKMKNGVPAYGTGNLVTKMGLKAAKPAMEEAERALPLILPRAMPKSKAEINAHAERVARQMMGEHVTSGKAGDTKNLAGRSMKESQRVKNLEYEIVPTKEVPESKPIQSQIGDINVALPGDFTLSDVELKSLMGEPINSRQEGGSRYGLGHLEDELPLFYASNEGPAQMVQNKVSDLYSLYEPERVMGQHMAMGPIATNFAQHFADANLKYTDYSKLRGADMDMFDQIMSQGYEVKKKNKKTGEVTIKVVDFPNWPGIADPQAAYEAMKKNPEMRKFYNRIMQTPTITEPLGFPSGQDVRYAITSPDLRDMEVNLVGHGVGRLVPNVDLTDTADHNTYAKGIRGIYEGHQDVLSPFAIAYPDATQHIITHQRPQDFTGTIQKVFPHQRVDQQFIDEMEQYRRRIKELTGKKKGGAIKKAAGGEITGDDLIIEERPL
jgi:hypothetical protein